MFEQMPHVQSAQEIENSGLNLADSPLLEDEKSLSGELGEDELEEVNGGILPIVAGALAIGGVVAGAAAITYGVGAVKGWMEGETEQAHECHK